MKKLLSVLIVIAMILSALPITSFAETMEQEIFVGDEISISLLEGDNALLYFTPEESGTYTLESHGESDTVAGLYNEYGDYFAGDDDSGEGNNFKITFDLDAGVTYHYDIYGYGNGAADFSVTLVQGSGENGQGSGEGSEPSLIEVERYLAFFDGISDYTYEFCPEKSGEYTIESLGGYDTKASLYVWNDDIEDYELLVEDSLGGENANFKITCFLEAGKDYHIVTRTYDAYGVEYEVVISYNPNVTLIDNFEAVFEDENYYYSFIPETSGDYTIYSLSPFDTNVLLRIYNIENDSYEELANDDDSGADTNFRLTYHLEAGELYEFIISCCDTDSVNVFLTLKTDNPFVEPIEIFVGDSLDFEFNDGQYAYLKFIPEETGMYSIESSGNSDTFVYLTDSNFEEIDNDDDGGEGFNFSLLYNLEAGETYYFRVSGLNDYSASFTVTLNKFVNPFESIIIDDVNVYENSNGFLGDSFFVYDAPKPEHITVTFKDGTTFEGNPYDFSSVYGYYWDYDIVDKQSSDNMWTVGGSYECWFSVLGVTVLYYANVVENPIESVSASDTQIYENTCGYYDTYWKNYLYNSVMPNEITVNFKDGTTFTGTDDELFEEYGYNVSISTGQKEWEAWSANNTYQGSITVLGVTSTFNISIIENPVSNITLIGDDHISILEHTNGLWETENGNEYYYYSNFISLFEENATFEVELKTGETFTATVDDIYDLYENIYYNFSQYSGKQWLPNQENEVTLEIMGCTMYYYVDIIEFDGDANGDGVVDELDDAWIDLYESNLINADGTGRGYLKGDLSYDGSVTVEDYALLKSYLRDIDDLSNYYEADINNDGAVDAFDLYLVNTYINNCYQGTVLK